MIITLKLFLFLPHYVCCTADISQYESAAVLTLWQWPYLSCLVTDVKMLVYVVCYLATCDLCGSGRCEHDRCLVKIKWHIVNCCCVFLKNCKHANTQYFKSMTKKHYTLYFHSLKDITDKVLIKNTTKLRQMVQLATPTRSWCYCFTLHYALTFDLHMLNDMPSFVDLD